jgi:hypothetical protein
VFCPNCGKQNSDGAVFCAGCGTRVSAAAAPMRSTIQQGPAGTPALFMQSVLYSVSRPDFFWTSVPLFLKVVAGLLGFSGAMISLRVLVSGFQEGAGASSVLGAFTSSLALGLATYMIVHACLIRARNIAELPESDHHAIPVFAVFVQLVGELSAVALVLLGTLVLVASVLPYGVSSLFMRVAAVGGYSAGTAFFTGMTVLIVCLIAAFLNLFLFHFIARSIVAFGGIAADAGTIREVAESKRGIA